MIKNGVLNPLLRSRRLAWLAFVLYSGLIFYFSLLPGEQIPPILFDLQDKLLHACGYFVLMLITAHAFFLTKGNDLEKRPYFWAFWYCAHVGAITEILQHYIPGRSTDMLDLLADTAGFSLASFVLYKLRPDKWTSLIHPDRRESDAVL